MCICRLVGRMTWFSLPMSDILRGTTEQVFISSTGVFTKVIPKMKAHYQSYGTEKFLSRLGNDGSISLQVSLKGLT